MKKITIIFILLLSILVSCGDEQIVKQNTTNSNNEVMTILALGDSLTAGYNLEIDESYPSQLNNLLQNNGYNYEIVNGGVSGDTSENLLNRIHLYDDTQVDIYLVAIGGNDGLRRLDTQSLKTNIESILNHIIGNNSDAKIILAGMQIPINYGLSYSRDFKKVYEVIAKEYDVYFYEFLLEDVAKDVELNLNDGIHPNADGYKIIANNLYNFIIKNKLITK